MAETERRASAELRKKSVKTKIDRASLVKRFGPGGNLATGLDQYNRWVLQEMDPEGQPRLVYLVVAENGRDWEVVNGTEAIKRIKTAYGNQDTLRKVLYDKGFMSENDYVSKSVSALNGAIIEAATEFSTEVADSFTTEGKMKFPTFQNWVTSRGAVGGEDRGPRRDIQRYDRDVVRQMVVDAYLDSPNANLPDESIIERDTDKYMKQIEKGTLTKSRKNKAGEFETVATPGFSEQRLRDEIAASRKKEFAADENTRLDLDFLAFLSQMEQR